MHFLSRKAYRAKLFRILKKRAITLLRNLNPKLKTNLQHERTGNPKGDWPEIDFLSLPLTAQSEVVPIICKVPTGGRPEISRRVLMLALYTLILRPE